MKMFCISTARPLTLILAVAALSAPALAQSGGLDDLVDGLAAESKEALAASAARVKNWFADADVQALKERADAGRSEEHTSELQALMRNSYAVFCLKKKTTHHKTRDKPPA